MVATSVFTPDLLEHDSVSSGENRASRAPLAGRHSTLLFDLLGQGATPLVCAFIPAKPSPLPAEFCLDLAFELAGSVAAQKQRVALVDGGLLLTGGSSTELQPLQSSTQGANRSEVWAWPAAVRPAAGGAAGPLHLQNSLASLRQNYEYIFLQCPPTSSMAGMAVALASMADKVVLLVPRGDVRRAEIQAAQRVLMLRGAPLVGSVLLDAFGKEGQ